MRMVCCLLLIPLLPSVAPAAAPLEEQLAGPIIVLQVAPRQQTRWRSPVLAGREDELRRLVEARPDRTLVELRAALRTSAALSTIWLMLSRLDLTVKNPGSRRRAAATRRPDRPR